MLWTKEFWKGAAERAIKSFAQSLAVVVGGTSVGLFGIDWMTALSMTGAYTLASILTSIVNADSVAKSQTRVDLSGKVKV